MIVRTDQYGLPINEDGVADISFFPEEQQREYARLAALSTPPPRWKYFGDPTDARPMAAIPSRAFYEWHKLRGRNTLKEREWMPSYLREAVIARDGLVCRLCGDPVERTDIHLDHIVPFSLGGPTTVDNLQVTHSTCNVRKGARA